MAGKLILKDRLLSQVCFSAQKCSSIRDFSRIKPSNYRKESSRIFDKSYFSRISKLGTGIALVTCGIVYYLYACKKKLQLASVLECGLTNTSNFRKNYNFIADVVEEAANAVVFISTSNTAAMFGTGGSGFIISSDGVIITNAHVIGNNYRDPVQVTMRNGQNFIGVVEVIDQQTDLALVKIKGNNLPVLKLASENNLRLGEWVAAIGSPFALANSVTAGVISAPHRNAAELGLRNKNMNYIQTDASITFGNSGGPLVNLDGEVIGVNSMTITSGISFAIPAEYVKEFLKRCENSSSGKDLIGTKNFYISSFRHMMVQNELNANDAPSKHEFSGDDCYQIAVYDFLTRIVSGLLEGDIIFEIDGKPASPELLHKAAREKGYVSMKILRNGQVYNSKVTPLRQ